VLSAAARTRRTKNFYIGRLCLLAFCCLRVSFSFQFALLCSPFTTASHPRGVSILIATTVAHTHTHSPESVPATTTVAISSKFSYTGVIRTNRTTFLKLVKNAVFCTRGEAARGGGSDMMGWGEGQVPGLIGNNCVYLWNSQAKKNARIINQMTLRSTSLSVYWCVSVFVCECESICVCLCMSCAHIHSYRVSINVIIVSFLQVLERERADAGLHFSKIY